MEELNKKQIINALLWRFLERIGQQGVQFIVSLILARLVSPSDYGIIGLISVYISISTVFIIGGFNTALIQKKDIDEEELSSVFYLSLTLATLCYIILFIAAPWIAGFYKEDILVSIIRIIGLTLFPGAINSIQNAVVSRNLDFKMYFRANIFAVVLGGSVGIFMAYRGYGVWALVGMQIVNSLAVTVGLWFSVKWRPKLLFSFLKVKILFSYGSKHLASNLITTIYNNIYSLIIGKAYNTNTLGYYNRGQQFPALIMSTIDNTITSVMLPTLSKSQDNKERLKAMMRRSIITSSYVLFPCMVGLATIAKPLVQVLLTDKWLPCVPFLQLSCFAYVFWPLHTTNVQAINAIGRSDLFLKLGIIKRLIGVILLIISIPFGVYAMMIANVISSIIGSIIHAVPNKNLLDYSVKEQIMDILPGIGISIIMVIVVYPIKFLIDIPILLMAFQILAGISIYVALSYFLKIECFLYIFDIIKGLISIRTRGEL